MASPTVAPRYLLGNDAAAAQRLRVLDEVYHSTTMALLERAGLREGWRCADIGCGTGLMTLAMAERVGAAGSVVGVDQAESFLNEARHDASKRELANVKFMEGDAQSLTARCSDGSRRRKEAECEMATGSLINPPPYVGGYDADSFDLVYARCLLSHLNEPLRALQAMAALARPGGCVVVEDIDCGGVFTHPEAPSLMRHLDLYQRVMRLNGGDPLIGRKLPRLCRKAGLTDVRFEVVSPSEPREAVKRLYPLTLACLKLAIVESNLATASEVDALVAELNAMANDPAETVSSCPMVQVWARKS
ncbi:MAG: methyltransferase domain-containing protein [Verrucomicrobia bacterium]|nr:methyltransferase domain-containing protein [Verrucomicrobiota bacterium]